MSAADQARTHWEGVYRTKSPDEVSWFEASPDASLRFLQEAGLPPSARVLDVGGGASRLVDGLLDLGFRPGVLDISGEALGHVRRRLGPRSEEVEWFEADVRGFESPEPWDAWHDRAVLHFLTDPAARDAYRATLRRTLTPEGVVVLATFAPDGPERCSGLDVRRYSAQAMADFLGAGFALERAERLTHRTPSGGAQHFQYARFRRMEA